MQKEEARHNSAHSVIPLMGISKQAKFLYGRVFKIVISLEEVVSDNQGTKDEDRFESIGL